MRLKQIFFGRTGVYSVLGILLSLNLNAQVMHAVLVADVEDRDMGKIAKKSIKTIQQKVKAIAKSSDLKFNPKIVYLKSGLGKKQVWNVLKNLYTNDQDVIFFYSITNGFRFKSQKAKDLFPALYMGSKAKGEHHTFAGITQQEIFDYLTKEKAAKLRVVISEASNISQPSLKASIVNRQATRSIDNFYSNYPKKANFLKLFRESEGNIIISSAEKEQRSWLTLKGGIFGNSFFKSLDTILSSSDNLSNAEMWNLVLKKTQTATLTAVKEHQNLIQVPQYSARINGTLIKSESPQLKTTYIDKAIEYWENAALLGNKDAIKRLKELKEILKKLRQEK